MIEMVQATMEHAAQMAPKMRDEDVAEVGALGFSPLEALQISLSTSSIAHAALLDGEPVAMWGICPENILGGGKALVWLLGTSQATRHGKTVLRASRTFVDYVQQEYDVLECFTDERYVAAVRLVYWLGFDAVGTAHLNGVPFTLFRRTR